MNGQHKTMKISTRFFILIGALFIIGGVTNIILVNHQMRKLALLEAELKSRNILNQNLAIHTYFSKQLKPKLFELIEPIRSKDYFEPTWMSSTYAIREINKYIRTLGTADYYYYKECAINARSPENEANNYEKAFLEKLSKNPELVVDSDIQTLQGKRYLVVLRRGEQMEESCLRCHRNPKEAPGGLVRYYGRERSFHRKVGDVVQASSIRVPLSAAYAEAGRFSVQLSGLLLMILILLFGSLFWLGKRWIFQPLDNIREKATVISTGSEHLGEEIPLPAGRELHDLTRSFNKMSENLRLNTDLLEERIKERTEELSLLNEHLKEEIQERIRTEEALRTGEERYKNLFDHMSDGVAIYRVKNDDEDFVFIDFNKSSEMIDNIKKEDVIGKSVLKIFPGVKDFGLFDVFKRVWKTGKPEKHPIALYEDERISGWRDNFVYKLPSGEIVAVYRDETEKMLAEEALKKSEAKFRAIFEHMDAASCLDEIVYDGGKAVDYRILDVNHSYEKVIGIKKEKIIGSLASQVYGTGEAPFLDIYSKVAETGQPASFEAYFAPIDKYLQVTSSCPEKGKFSNVFSDITERKRAEEERDNLQAQLSNAMEMAHLGHWEYDVANDLFTFNDHFYKIFRTTARQVGGYTMSSAEYARRFVHPDDMTVVEEENRKAIEATDLHFSRQLEHRMLYADGTVGHISVRFFIVKDSHGLTVRTCGVNQDITDLKRMEEDLLRAQKLESVGLLAGGIAHDFNNILTTIIGNVFLAKNQAAPGDEIFDLLNEAEMASARAQTLTKQLLTFAKGGAPLKEIASVEDIVKESCGFVLRGSKSRCEFSIAEDLWPADVDVGQVSQVINNVVINANQAMPKGGIIQVAAENLTIEDRHGLPLKPDRYIRISITDHGVGIAEDHLLNIFDPYFTTKQEGSGLGLATTYSIIKKHDGHIAVESRLGVGTTFHIYLPASDKIVPEKEEVELIKGHGRILVMDDEASLRKMVGRMLGNMGYESEFAKNGAEAIEMYKEAQESEKPYDAVIMDLTIPGGMGGKEAINKLLEIDPEVKAIVSSGYSDDPVLANFQEYGFMGMMPKPFESLLLGKVLHELLKGEKE